MRPTPWLRAEPFRIHLKNFIVTKYGDDFGAFVIPYKGQQIRCIVGSAANGIKDLGENYAWDHISVSLKDRCPTWNEMTYIKTIFFSPDETVVQFHPPETEYINIHHNTLHLWRPSLLTIPLPPRGMV
jgi:hypothetical protein